VPHPPRDPDTLATRQAGEGPRVVLVHGFTQTARCWGPFADELVRAGNEVLAVDAPGHGGSGSIHTDLPEGSRRIAAVGGRGTYIGYSMGARYALRLALDQPDLVDALVLIGGTAGIEDPGERAERRAADEARAARLEAVGVAAFVDEWLQLPLFSTLPDHRAFREERLRNTVPGLASSLRLAGTGAMGPLWSRLASIEVPVLLVTGEHDTKFTAIAQRMVHEMDPHAWAAVVSDVGHSVHLEQPETAARLVSSWRSTRG
jgi:2-succinyl-6-hydroxy-2,4-cyclohexadiene-1-carboxylate synthase